jgi:hypothetical protein
MAFICGTVSSHGIMTSFTNTDVSSFTTETYHMIDTCDSQVACWSDDGETFIVKDPAKFERTIIPQFFKHSKFSSFVRVSATDGILEWIHVVGFDWSGFGAMVRESCQRMRLLTTFRVPMKHPLTMSFGMLHDTHTLYLLL